MEEETLVFPEGTVISFTSVGGDGYVFEGTVVTLSECDLPALAEEYRFDMRTSDCSGFVDWLISNAYVDPVYTEDVCIGCDGEFAAELGGDWL